MFQKVDPKELDFNVFSAIGDQWMLITAGTKDKCNTMTASWGGLGILWGAPMAIAYIRPQRYTKQFVDENEFFTLSFFSQDYRRQLSLCGSKSGRDVDKFAEMHLTAKKGEKVDCPIILESPVNIECKVKEIVPLGSHHMFLAEVVSVSVSEKYFDKTGKFHLNRSKPICYSHGGYFTLGEQVGSFGYSVRKKDTPKTGTKQRKRRSGKKQRQK